MSEDGVVALEEASFNKSSSRILLQSLILLSVLGGSLAVMLVFVELELEPLIKMDDLRRLDMLKISELQRDYDFLRYKMKFSVRFF
jgi:hypothetical protein